MPCGALSKRGPCPSPFHGCYVAAPGYPAKRAKFHGMATSTSLTSTELGSSAADALKSPTAASLVEHAFAIDADETLDNVDRKLQAVRHEFAAVVDNGVVIGTCSRSLLRRLVGGRYGFALYAGARVREHLNKSDHRFAANTSMRELLDVALAREDEEFYHDVVVVDDDQHLVGLVSTLRLVRAQSQLMADQYLLLDHQRSELERVNDDLRDSLELQRKLEHQVVQEAKSALLQSLAGGIAHEINNKLVPIMGYAELMAEQAAVWGDDALQDYCMTVRTCALESAQIIRQLLELSKPSAPALAVVDLRALIEQAMTFTQLRIKESDTTFELDLPDAEAEILADATKIKQVVVNLVLNAIDAMAQTAERRLSVRLTVADEVAKLVVRDSGSGIPANCIDRIFDPFFTTKQPNQGTGLGLSVCRTIARQHLGEISVESTTGLGSTFTLTLPIGRQAAVEAAPGSIAPLREIRTTDHRGIPALVVDDEFAAGHLVKHALERTMGLDVSWVTDGELAISRLRDHDYAVIVSDMRMPKVDGMELLAWIGKHRPDMATRILFITGDSAAERNDTAVQAGARLLLKPFKIDDLTRECRLIIERWNQAAQS
jgi:signal transduction histidine kinase/CheY-like chemotaxis protein